MIDQTRRRQHVEQRIRKQREAVLVINCRSRRGARLRPRAEALLRERGYTLIRSYAVTDPGTLDTILREALADHPPLLVLGSGDGTVASAVDHLAHTDTVLAYLPMGTTNNLARSVGLPLRLKPAIDLLDTGQIVEIDLGVANGDHFANMASLGVSVAVSDHTPHRLKRWLGRPAYALTGAAALRTHQPFTATITVDGVTRQLRTHQLNIANGSVHAGVRIGADARIDDGLLAAYRLGGTARWSAATGILAQALTPHWTLRRKGHLVGEHIRVETDPPQLVELDGETVSRTPLEVSVARGALHILVPARPARPLL